MVFEVDEPLELLLKDTLTRATMLTQNSIQARLGGIRLPTTIHQHNEVIANLGNLIAMQEYMRHTIYTSNHGVGRLPILAVTNSSVHLGFDLTHESFAVDLGSMGQDGGN